MPLLTLHHGLSGRPHRRSQPESTWIQGPVQLWGLPCPGPQQVQGQVGERQ